MLWIEIWHLSLFLSLGFEEFGSQVQCFTVDNTTSTSLHDGQKCINRTCPWFQYHIGWRGHHRTYFLTNVHHCCWKQTGKVYMEWLDAFFPVCFWTFWFQKVSSANLRISMDIYIVHLDGFMGVVWNVCAKSNLFDNKILFMISSQCFSNLYTNVAI